MCVFSWFFLWSNEISAMKENKLYYVRADLKTVNGVTVESNLIMVPARKEYRIKKFMIRKVTGVSDQDTRLDLSTSAEHNALINLLIHSGLMSVNGKRTTSNIHSEQEITISYEGVIKFPLKTIRENFIDNNTRYSVDLEVTFAPIADPDDWKALQEKQKKKSLIESILSLFK